MDTNPVKNRFKPPADVQSYLGLAAVILVAASAIVGQLAVDRSAQILANLTMVFGTFYVSFLISRHFAVMSSRKELQDLAEASGTRVFLLCSQMKELAEDILNYEPDGESSKIYYEVIATQLTRLAGQAELSFEDLQRIAKVNISIPKLREDVETRVVEGARREKIPCPGCKAESDVIIGSGAGASKHCRCAACGKLFMAHRLSDGGIKLSYSDEFEIRCPNEKCTNLIRIRRGTTDWGTAVRNCYECFARIRFDLDRKKVEGFTIEAPLSLPSSQIIDGQCKCPYCSWLVSFRESRNSRGEWIQFCPHCTKLIKVQESVEPAHAPEPAVGPVSNGEPSPPAR